MGILDEMKAESVRKGPSCSVGLARAEMSKEELADFDAACADPAIVTTIILRVMARRGYTLRAEALRRHRRGDCRCE